MTVDPKFCPPAPIPDAVAVSEVAWKRLQQIAETIGGPAGVLRLAQHAAHAAPGRARLKQFAIGGECLEVLIADIP